MHETHKQALKRNMWVNAVGLVGRAVLPLSFVAVSWWFGAELFGEYMLGFNVFQVLISFIGGGLGDAVVVYASHHADQAKHDSEEAGKLHHVVGSALVAAVALSVAVALTLAFVGAPFFELVFPEYDRLHPAALFIGLALVPTAFTRIAVAAAKAQQRMEWDVILVGFLSPALFLGAAFVVHRRGGDLRDLFLAQTVTETFVALLACVPLVRNFRIRQLLHLRSLRPHPHVMRFAFPQTLNLLFNRYASRVDVFMLGAFSVDAALLGWYGFAATVITEIRQIRVVIGQSLAPIVARLHREHATSVLEDTLARYSRWALTLVVPVALLVVAMRDEASRLIDPGYTGNSNFIILLCAVPVINCAFGLADNYLVCFGRSRWNLLNSVTMAIVNTALNAILIPTWELLGAAVATASAIGAGAALATLEIGVLDRVRYPWRELGRPLFGLLLIASGWYAYETMVEPSWILRLAGWFVVSCLWLAAGLLRPDRRAASMH